MTRLHRVLDAIPSDAWLSEWGIKRRCDVPRGSSRVLLKDLDVLHRLRLIERGVLLPVGRQRGLRIYRRVAV